VITRHDGRRGGRVTADPFAALGLPARPDLTGDDVRAAWRRIAAATHPDRADGGDPERYAVASAAYADLRTGDGRGEAYADLAARNRRRERLARGTASPQGTTPAPGATSGRAAAGLASRIRQGRPALLAVRVAGAAGVCVAAFGIAGAEPAAAGLATGALTWLLLTARRDLGPPGERVASGRWHVPRSFR
jgi:hypothetical protein